GLSPTAGPASSRPGGQRPRPWRVPGRQLLCPAGLPRAAQARLRHLQGQTFGFQTFDANPSTRAWLITLEAEAHALAGNERAALIALDAADTAMVSAAEEDTSRRPRAAFFGPARLIGERGVALGVLPVKVVDEDRYRGEVVERGGWSPVMVEPQRPGQARQRSALERYSRPSAHASARVFVARSPFPSVLGR